MSCFDQRQVLAGVGRGPRSVTTPGIRGNVRAFVCGCTDQGRRRRTNQDRFLVVDLSAEGAGALLEGGGEPPDFVGTVEFQVGEFGGLVLVADGMGGAAGGEVASAMAAEIIHETLSRDWVGHASRNPDDFARHLVRAVEGASRAINVHARNHIELRGMGTTSTLVGILGDILYLAQVGDSRAYLVRAGKGTQITRDQSVVQTMMEAGTLTEEQAERSPHGNLILQALGTHPELDVDLTHQALRRGDVLLVCSDGLSGLVRGPEMAEIVNRGKDLQTAGEELVALANDRGGPDNVTVVLGRFDGEGLLPPQADDHAGSKKLLLH